MAVKQNKKAIMRLKPSTALLTPHLVALPPVQARMLLSLSLEKNVLREFQ
jgi:hypothetical protein